MSFLLSFFGFLSVLTVRIDWLYDWMDIPLHANIDEYQMLPEARLYIDGAYVVDPDMYYERDGVDHTFFSVVSTSYIKTYTIRYRVTFPNYAVTQTKDIVFNIVDVNAPVFDALPHFKIPLGESIPDLSSGVVFHDDYDNVSELILDINSYDIIIDRIGTYPIYYQISDRSGNIKEGISSLEVYDASPPLITQVKDLNLAYGDDFSWKDYFKVTDNADSYPKVITDLSLVDFSTLGIYDLTITAIDSNRQVATRTYELHIIDIAPPTLLVKSKPTPIEVHTDPDSVDFLDYILSVTDDYDLLDKPDVSFLADVEYDVLGTYDVIYTVKDHSGNTTEVTMKIEIADTIKPTISIISPLVFDVFDPEPFYMEYVNISDNYTDHDGLDIKMDESVKMNIIGKYPITFEAKDESGNIAILNTYVEIIDRIAPEITQTNDILITDFTQKDVSFYFLASDNYDKEEDLRFQMDDDLVDYEKVGSYPLFVHVFDRSDKEGIFESEIIIADIIEPVLTLSDQMIFIDVQSTSFDPLSLILEVSDNYDELVIDDVKITGEIDYMSIGLYTLTYQLSDSSLNMVQKTVSVYVDDRTPPEVNLGSRTLSVGEPFNLLEGVDATDNISDVRIITFPESLDTSTPGIKEVTYIVYDERGNFTQKIREITILETNQAPSVRDYIPVILVTVIGLIAAFYIYKKMG